jgi:hypothetical protein
MELQKRSSARRAFLLCAPIALPLLMWPVFVLLPRLLGTRPGYFAGFVVWWACCAAFALACGSLRFTARAAPLRASTLVLLLWPLAVSFAFAFPRVVASATVPIVLSSAALALVNGGAEEWLWRGAYAQAFGHNRWLGVVWPAIGFAAWHFAPQTVFASRYPAGAWGLVMFSFLLGLSFGEVAWRTRSLWPVVVAHVLLDFSGLGGRLYFPLSD